MENLLDFALEYEKLGWFVLPADPNEKKPLVKWKDRRDRRPTPEEIRGWWKRRPDARIAIATGSRSGFDVVDVDGPEALEKLIAICGRVPDTIYQTTGRDEGGRHFLFKHNGHGLKSHAGGGLDLRTTNDIIIVAPSPHKSGRMYAWGKINPLEHGLDDLTEWPPELVEYFKSLSGTSARKDGSHEPTTTGPVPKGKRHNTILRLVGKWLYKGLDHEAIWLNAFGWWEALSDKTDFPVEELEIQVQDLIDRYGKPKALNVVSQTAPTSSYHLTDTGNGKRFTDQHRENAKYCYPEARWFVWDGTRWKPDNQGVVRQLAKQTTQLIYQEAVQEPDADRRSKIGKWAANSESAFRQEAMLKLAQDEPGVPILPEDMDKDPWLLNVENGTVDLKTGRLLPHRKSDLISKIAPIVYDPQATCPRWLEFLNTIMNGDSVMVEYLCRVAGYSLTGDTGEQCLFVYHGNGQNGKSTYLNVIQSILEDYAVQTGFDTFTIRRGEGIRNDIARMKTVRMVVAIEAGDGKRLDEQVIKQLTGGDKVTARFLHQEFFEFRPRFKISLVANHKPIISGQDYAIWRRIRLIPFDVQIPEDKRVNNFEKVLLEEKQGILNWMIRGCLEWQRVGLADPEKVKAATALYRTEMDVLEDFIDSRCVLDPDYKTTHGELFTEYQDWCRKSNETPYKTKFFAKMLELKGFTFTKPHNIKTWHGIGIMINGYRSG